MHERRSRGPLLVAALVAILGMGAAPPAATDGEPTPMIVVLERDADVDAAVARGRRDHAVRPSNTFRHAARGYAADLTPGQARAIARDPAVLDVIPDSVVELTAQSIPFGVRRVGTTRSPLTHIDGGDFSSQRPNVDIAIIDTGIQPDHPDLRVAGGYDCSRPGTPANERVWPSRWRDEHGHGTHVAGIAAAIDNGTGVVGVAPGARLWSVRVFDPTGFSRISWIACGIDWITSKRDPSDAARPLIEVANMSLRDEGGDDGNCGYTIADIEHQAICRSTARGTTYVVAAGNDSNGASHWRPASYDEVITVSAMADFDGKPGGLGTASCTSFGRRDVDDTFADFSNYGADIDLIAPGVCVYSTIRGSSYGRTSGTSMATPHVAGGAALYHVAHPGATSVEVRAALRAAGTFDWRTGSDRDSTVEPLLDVSSFGAGAGLRLRSTTTTIRLWSGQAGATVRFELARLDGQSGTVTMSADGLPEGVTASFSKSTFNGRDFGAATVSIRATSAAPSSDATVTITARSGGHVATHPVRVIVQDDAAGPVIGSIAEGLVVPSTVTTGGPLVTTTWVATDTGSGIVSSTVGERRNGGAWTTVATTGSSTRSRTARMPYAVTFQHRVRATDVAGNTGSYLLGPETELSTYTENTSLAGWSSGWSFASIAGTLGGRVRFASTAGASVTLAFDGVGVGWISRTSPTSGSARVSIDGTVVDTVSLRSSSSATARLVFADNLPRGPHTLRIDVLGTSGGARVDVDGFIIER
jgi:subtilisin family serine protease